MARKPEFKGGVAGRGPLAGLTHVDAKGAAHMVDVSEKPETRRLAVAEGRVIMNPSTLDIVAKGNARKGDVLGTARLAAIMAAKRTHELIPLCHPLMLTNVTVDIEPDPALPGCLVRASVKTMGQTGVEMEALTAVAVGCLTVYDMIKAVDRSASIEGIRLIEKKGGKSGHYKSGHYRATDSKRD